MDALVKGSLYLGTVLFLGAGFFGRFIGPGLYGVGRPLRLGALLGAVIVAVGSVLNIVTTLQNVLGFFDSAFFWEYVRSTYHGLATLVRLGLVVALTLLAFYRTSGRVANTIFVSGGVGFLATFSWISHNAAMGGFLPLVADLVHLIAATAWVGAVFYTAFSPLWSRAELAGVMRRVSQTGLFSVGLLFASGVYSSLLHIPTLASLVTTLYGRVLVLKLALVLVVLSLAAVNRFVFLPSLTERTPRTFPFRRALGLEALLLATVLGVTGLLTTSPMPH